MSLLIFAKLPWTYHNNEGRYICGIESKESNNICLFCAITNLNPTCF